MFLGNCLLIHIYLDTYQKDTTVADYEAKVLYVCNFSIQSYFISRRLDEARGNPLLLALSSLLPVGIGEYN